MAPRCSLRKRDPFAFALAIVVSFGVFGSTLCYGADDPPLIDPAADFMPGSDAGLSRPPATFFSINAVLAKVDQQRGRGPDALRLAALTPSNVATDAPPAQKDPPERSQEPFGLFTFRAPEGVLWRKWRGVEADISREETILQGCREHAEGCPSYAAQFLRLIEAVKSKSGRAQLEEANRAVNTAIRYVSDYAQHGEPDRWSAPLATFSTGKGDCEDYAIAKYVALKQAGFSPDELRLLLVRDRAARQDHAVLASRLDDRWLILDNRSSELIEDTNAASFTPLFAINHRGVHLIAAPYAKRPLLDRELQAAPAAARDASSRDGSGRGISAGTFSTTNSLPLLM
jgi:predicted transglutaminase-like cysteine proteinase